MVVDTYIYVQLAKFSSFLLLTNLYIEVSFFWRVATVKIAIKTILLLAQNWEQFKIMNSNLSQYKIAEVEKCSTVEILK